MNSPTLYNPLQLLPIFTELVVDGDNARFSKNIMSPSAQTEQPKILREVTRGAERKKLIKQQ